MALGDVLGTALSGMSAAQTGLRAVSNNIANAQTVGYARARVDYVPLVAGGTSNGVRALELSRVADRFLEQVNYAAKGEASRSGTTSSYLGRISGLLGEPGQAGGLTARLDEVQSAAIDLASLGTTGQARDAIVAKIGDALTETSRIAGEVDRVRADVDDEAMRILPQVNSLLIRIRDLNEEVVKSTALGKSVSGSADARAAAIGELSGMIGVTAREGSDGRVTIETRSGQVLLDRRARELVSPAVGGAATPLHPPIAIRMIDPLTGASVATAETLDAVAAGGELGALVDLRDRTVPQLSEQMKNVGAALAATLNKAANRSMPSPPLPALLGRNTGLVGADRLGMTGQVTVSALDASGKVVAKADVDLSTTASIDDAVTALNAQLGSGATVSFSNGRLSMVGGAGVSGIAFGDTTTSNPTARAGTSFGQFFGLNDIVQGLPGTLTPSGLQATDPHGASAGQTMSFAIRDSAGRVIVQDSIEPAATGTTVGDIVTAMNGGPLGQVGSFALDASGRIGFTPKPSFAGSSLWTVGDSTSRAGTGAQLSNLLDIGMGRAPNITAGFALDPQLAASPARLPMSKFVASAGIGEVAVAKGDASGANSYVDALMSPVGIGPAAGIPLDRFTAQVLGGIGQQAKSASDYAADNLARAEEAQLRRDSYSGVNIDEELAQMVILQNSYSAAARVLSVARDMNDTLMSIIR